jgi:hypothetical protein
VWAYLAMVRTYKKVVPVYARVKRKGHPRVISGLEAPEGQAQMAPGSAFDAS